MSLDEQRKRIDEIDKKILDLLNERARAAIEIGKIKQPSNSVFYVPDREQAVYDSLADRNERPLPTAAV